MSQYQIPKLIHLNLFTELFHDYVSSRLRTNRSHSCLYTITDICYCTTLTFTSGWALFRSCDLFANHCYPCKVTASSQNKAFKCCNNNDCCHEQQHALLSIKYFPMCFLLCAMEYMTFVGMTKGHSAVSVFSCPALCRMM